MKRIARPFSPPPNPPRRRFLQGLAAGGVLAALSPRLILLARGSEAAGTMTGSAPVLRGAEFDLVIAETAVNFTGAPRLATTVNGSIPAPTLRWRQGDTVTLRVTNRLAHDTSIHWHGILLPFEMDGVPGISFKGIAPGETFTYRFEVRQYGTYWYHSHSGFQEQTGLYGAIVIDPAEAEPIRADREHVVLLSDWTDEDPARVLAKLKVRSDYYNFNQPTMADFFRDISNEGLETALAKRRMWNRMRMNPTDLADVSGHTYTYLMNGTTPAGNWMGLFRRGERVRLRLINGSASTFFDVRIPGLALTVVQADGQDVEPVTVDEIRIGVAETYDVLVSPQEDAYTIFAQSLDRSGYARGTLAVRAGLDAPVPAPDKPVWLGMDDMMGSMAHGDMAGMDMSSMKGMDSGGMESMKQDGMLMAAPPVRVRHAKTEYGPAVDMRVDTPRTNLDDPGVGLRDNGRRAGRTSAAGAMDGGSGRRVLTYADLRTIGGPLDTRGAEREIELHLTGNMRRFAWSIDGLSFSRSRPIHFRHGERLRVILHNDTMMTHPMHLHGMWSELETPEGDFQARKHTLNVQPAQRISFLVTADAPGRWAFHCHLLYHMDVGMFREVVVA